MNSTLILFSPILGERFVRILVVLDMDLGWDWPMVLHWTREL